MWNEQGPCPNLWINMILYHWYNMLSIGINAKWDKFKNSRIQEFNLTSKYDIKDLFESDQEWFETNVIVMAYPKTKSQRMSLNVDLNKFLYLMWCFFFLIYAKGDLCWFNQINCKFDD